MHQKPRPAFYNPGLGLQVRSYYPFGMVMPGRGYSGGDYKYGFNGQERETEIGPWIYTADFWEYNPSTVRRYNLDPAPLSAVSPYSTFNNSPIILVDVNGDIFTPSLKKEVEQVRKETRKTLSKLNDLSANLKLQIVNTQREIDEMLFDQGEHADGSEMLNEKQNQLISLKNEIEQVGFAQKQLNTMMVELKNMEEDKQKFDIKYVSNGKDGGTSVEGGVIVFTIPLGNSLDISAHEFKHGHQYLTGELSWDTKNNSPGMANDIYDEVDAYQREWAFDYFDNRSSLPNYQQITPEFVRTISSVYNVEHYYHSRIDINSLLARDRLIHYFGTGWTSGMEPVAKEYVNKPIRIISKDLDEFFIE